MAPFSRILLSLGFRLGWATVGAWCGLAYLSSERVRRATAHVPNVAVLVEAPRLAPSAEPEALHPSKISYPIRPRAFSAREIAACGSALAHGGVLATSWSVTYVGRTEVERLIEQQADRMGCGRGLPLVGIRVEASESNAPALRLGFRRGDLLLSVNGYDLSTPDRALEAYARLRGAEDFAVVFVRDGVVQARLIRVC
jgi:hypothetical protein